MNNIKHQFPKQFISLYDNELSVFTSEEAKKLKINSYTYLIFACLKQQYKYKLSVGGRASTSAGSLERVFNLPNKTVSRELKKILSSSSNIISVSDNYQYKINGLSKDTKFNAIPIQLLVSPTLDVKTKQFLAALNRYLKRVDGFAIEWSEHTIWKNVFKPLSRSRSWVSDRLATLCDLELLDKGECGFVINMEKIADYADREYMRLANSQAITSKKSKGFNEFDYGIDI